MADISKIKLPNGDIYDIKDANAVPASGGTFTGPVTFSDTINAVDANVGDLVVTGAASITNTLAANTMQTNKVLAPTSSGGSTYGLGTDGQVLKTNGTTVYWGTITVPTKTSDLTNDSGYLTLSTLPIYDGTVS